MPISALHNSLLKYERADQASSPEWGVAGRGGWGRAGSAGRGGAGGPWRAGLEPLCSASDLAELYKYHQSGVCSIGWGVGPKASGKSWVPERKKLKNQWKKNWLHINCMQDILL
jgi:hypothetical protein